jgi:hypothetical protein
VSPTCPTCRASITKLLRTTISDLAAAAGVEPSGCWEPIATRPVPILLPPRGPVVTVNDDAAVLHEFAADGTRILDDDARYRLELDRQLQELQAAQRATRHARRTAHEEAPPAAGMAARVDATAQAYAEHEDEEDMAGGEAAAPTPTAPGTLRRVVGLDDVFGPGAAGGGGADEGGRALAGGSAQSNGGNDAALPEMAEKVAYFEERKAQAARRMAVEEAAFAAGFAPPDETDGDGYDSTGGVEEAVSAHRAGRMVLVRSEDFPDAVEDEEHEWLKEDARLARAISRMQLRRANIQTGLAAAHAARDTAASGGSRAHRA